MGKCKKDVTPLLTHWSYVFLAPTHRYAFCMCHFCDTEVTHGVDYTVNTVPVGVLLTQGTKASVVIVMVWFVPGWAGERLTHWGLVTSYGVIGLGQNWVSWWLIAWLASMHYLNHTWLIVDWLAVILPRSQYVKQLLRVTVYVIPLFGHIKTWYKSNLPILF